MKRRRFLAGGLGACAGMMWAGDALAQEMTGPPAVGRPFSRFSHKFPLSEKEIGRHVGHIEDVPVPEYHWASDAAYDAFLDLKFGIRLHWGIYSIWSLRGESWPFLSMDFAKRHEYQQLYRTWNPTGFDAERWMDLFEAAGAKMFAFTGKHHEGFSMFDTKTRVARRVDYAASGGPRIENCDLAYSIMETPFGRDVVRELTQAARRRGIKIDLYFSQSDWYDTDFRPYGYHPVQCPSAAQLSNAQNSREESEQARAKRLLADRVIVAPDPSPAEVEHMHRRFRAQLTELLGNYGSIDMLCLDIWLGKANWPFVRETLIGLRKLHPEVMFRARGINNYGDYYTPEGFVPGDKEATDMPWFVIYPLARSFSYDSEAKNYKGPDWIVRNIVDSAAKGGCFMAGIGPGPDGTFHPIAEEQLRAAGKWLKVNGAGIYASRAREGAAWKEGDAVRFTRAKDGKTLYAWAMNWPGEKLTLKTVRAADGSPIRMFGHAEPLAWRNDPVAGLVIDLPPAMREANARPCEWIWGFRIEGRTREAEGVS